MPAMNLVGLVGDDQADRQRPTYVLERLDELARGRDRRNGRSPAPAASRHRRPGAPASPGSTRARGARAARVHSTAAGDDRCQVHRAAPARPGTSAQRSSPALSDDLGDALIGQMREGAGQRVAERLVGHARWQARRHGRGRPARPARSRHVLDSSSRRRVQPMPAGPVSTTRPSLPSATRRTASASRASSRSRPKNAMGRA